jgi:hypothetical protein
VRLIRNSSADSSGLQSRDIGRHHAPQPGITDMLEPRLEAGDVLLDLLDERQIVSQLCQRSSGSRRGRSIVRP